MTVLGNYYRTGLIDNTGTDAYFDEDSGQGEMLIPLYDGKLNDSFVLAVRSMHANEKSEDTLLGETLVYVAKDLLVSPGVKKSFPLRSKGKLQENKGAPSEVTLSCVLQEIKDKHYVLLTCHETTNLRSANFLGKNNVYVECYPVPSNTDKNLLPKPNKNYTIHKGTEISLPFSTKLPLKCIPTSFEEPNGCSYVRYSLNSNIDTTDSEEPFFSRYITVLSSELPSPSLLAPLLRPKMDPQMIYD